MLKTLYLLEGEIILIKTIETASYKETLWEDENGDRAVIYREKVIGENA